MRSAIVGLARQGVVVAGVSALLIGAIYSGTNSQRRAEAARQSAIAPPLQVQSVVSASPISAPAEAPAPATALQAKTAPKASCASPPCARAAPAKAQLAAARPAPERPAEPIVIASAVEPPRDSSFAKRLLGPVDALRGQVDALRSQVARLFSRP